jgi:hypothetical protein
MQRHFLQIVRADADARAIGHPFAPHRTPKRHFQQLPERAKIARAMTSM